MGFGATGRAIRAGALSIGIAAIAACTTYVPMSDAYRGPDPWPTDGPLAYEAWPAEPLEIADDVGERTRPHFVVRQLSIPAANNAEEPTEFEYYDVDGDARTPVVVLLPRDPMYPKTLSNLKEVEARGGRIIALTDDPTPELEEIAWEVVTIPRANHMLAPVLLSIPLQLLAYFIAIYRGTDVDQPRNLAKSVTVE